MTRKLRDSPAEAKAYALKLLSYRGRSRRELHDKLTRKGFSDGQISSTIDYLDELGLMNDEALASDLYRYSSEYKYLGEKGIRMFLAGRGIERDLVDKALSAHTTEREVQSAKEFVERKLRTLKNYPEDVIKRKLWGMLQRRGFSVEVIKRVV